MVAAAETGDQAPPGAYVRSRARAAGAAGRLPTRAARRGVARGAGRHRAGRRSGRWGCACRSGS